MALFWRCYEIVYGNTFFFLLIYFSVVEDFQLPKTSSYVISLPLTMEFIRNFNPSLLCSTLIVSLMMFCVRLLSELMKLLSTHHFTNHLTCRKHIETAYEMYFHLKNMKMQYQKYQKMQLCIELYIDIWKIILYLQANPYWLKSKNIKRLIFISTIIK